MAIERLYIENTYIPLDRSLTPSITKQITDLEQPEKRKMTHSKTVTIPRSKEADKIFEQMFEVNIIDRTFNPNLKADVLYTVDDETIIDGFIQLQSLSVTDFEDIVYSCVMFSDVADFWATIKNGFLTDLYTTTASFEGLDKYDHQLTKEIQQYSWDNQVWYDGAFIPFSFGTGYVYPLIDYGYSSDATNFTTGQIGCAIYAWEYMKKIISWAGFEYDSTFLDSTFFKHLIIPSSPQSYVLDSTEITARQFVANTPKFNSTGNQTTNNLPNNSLSSNDQIIFTNDSVAPATDPGLNYNPTTGVFEAVSTGYYDFTVLVDLQVEFKPSTATAVKTRCEVDGYILMTYSNDNGVTQTQINAVPFYITYDDSAGFISGTRTTQSSPSYPETDYLDAKHWSIFPQDTSLTGRPYAVPNRYQLTVNNIFMVAGSEIRVFYKAGLWSAENSIFSGGGYTTNFFIDALNNYYTGTAKLQCSVGAFYNKVANTSLAQGNTLTMNKIIPNNIKMTDFFTSILKMFNLWVDIDPENPNKLIIESRDTYLGADVLNIHELIDRSKEMVHLPMGALNVKKWNYKYKEDKDYWNQYYQTKWGMIYGNREVESVSDFLTAENDTQVIFSPTTMVGLPNQDRVLPTIYQLTDTNQPINTTHNIRILYYAGLIPCSTGWNHIDYLLAYPYLALTDTFVEYPYAGHWDDPFDPTLDINFGLVEEVFYDNNLQDINPTDNNLVNAYHSKQLAEITDPESRIVRAYVHLTPAMYKQFTFDKLYYFDFAYFRLQKIENYNPASEETTLCEFLQLIDAGVFTPDTFPADGNPAEWTPDIPTTGGVSFDERVPVMGTKSMQQPDQNNYSDRSVKVSGEGNLVNPFTKSVEIYGNGNIVESEAKNIKIQGDNNTVAAGLKNVTLINTSNVDVTEDNVTYVNGIRQNYWKTETTNFTADKSVQGYYLDATSGNLTVTLTEREEAWWIFKRVDTSTNTVTIQCMSANIDGETTQTLDSYESVGIRWNSGTGEFNIVD